MVVRAIATVLFALLASSALAGEKPELVIYTYDSMVAQGGLGPAIFPKFEARCGCKVRALASGDGGQLLSRLEIDLRRKKPSAQLVLGIDQQLWQRARPMLEDWGAHPPAGYSDVPSKLRVGPGFLPFDFGYFAFMADKKALAGKAPPHSLKELLSTEWKRKLLLEDPRTSTPGLAFLLYTQSVMGTDATEGYWSKLKTQWLTLAPGWDAAYGLFLKGEAPLVWSYTTSQAYHREHGDSEHRYEALIFDEGQPVQIEGAALIRGGSRNDGERALARSFLEFLLTDEAQAVIPKTNWMLPVIARTKLPESFQSLPSPVKALMLPARPEDPMTALAKWSNAVEIGHE